MISKFFIDRPVFSIVLSLLIMIAGGAAIYTLPTARYPEITPPTIQISASYPGADAQTVAESVAAPIEQQLSGIKNLLYFQSQSANDGSVSITATFEIGTNQDLAAVEVQNRVALAEPRIPAEVRQQGIQVIKSSANILGIVSLQSDDPQYDALFLSNYATINVLDRLKRVEGVGEAITFGNQNYSMRIWVDPDRLALKGLTIDDVSAALRDQNAVFPAGTIGQRPSGGPVKITVPVLTRGRLADVAEYENITLRATNDAAMVKLKDVARVELGSESYGQLGQLNGKDTAMIIVNLQTGANALSTMNAVRAEMKQVESEFPKGIRYSIPYETASFVEVSIRQVVFTLLEAVVLVIIVVFIFLQSVRATLIPLLAVPVAIIGAFAGMLLLGFSINTLTLFGLVLAIGIVVDDAIVVVENVERLMHVEHLSPYDATVKAMQQVTGPVIAIVLVLSAVFVPVTFLGGLTGQLYKQFAVTIAVSVAISGFVALTLSPALCAMLLKPAHGKKNILFRGFDSAFNWLTEVYGKVVGQAIRFGVVTIVLFGVLCFATYRMFQVVPSGFLPDEDQGYVIAIPILPDGASLDETQAVIDTATAFYMKHPAVMDVTTLVGFDLMTGGASNTNTGAVFVTLKPFDQRKDPSLSSAKVVEDSQALFGMVDTGIVLTLNPPAIDGLGNRSGFTAQLQQRGGGSLLDLAEVNQQFLAAAAGRPEIVDVNSTLRYALPQVFVEVNREKAQMLGVALAKIFEPLQSYFGTLYVNDFNKFGRIWRVQVQAEPEFRNSPEDVNRVYVRSESGNMVPLSSLVDMKFRAGPNVVSRFNGYPSVEITGASGPGFSSGETMSAVTDVAGTLPPGFSVAWSGATYQEIKAGNQTGIVLGFGLVVVFLVLAAQYERWTLPIGVLLAVPTAVLGALIAVWFRGYTKDLYFQIGLLTLVGLAAKNAILIVEFCMTLREQGRSLRESAIEAAKLRFRPIVMTSLAFILGVVPLSIATGAGAAGQRSIGTGVIGGMLAATFLAIIFVPLFFVICEWISERFRRTPHRDRSRATP